MRNRTTMLLHALGSLYTPCQIKHTEFRGYLQKSKAGNKTDQKRIPQLWKSINAPPHIFDGNSIFIQDKLGVNYKEAQKTTN